MYFHLQNENVPMSTCKDADITSHQENAVVKHHYTPTGMAEIKKRGHSRCW